MAITVTSPRNSFIQFGTASDILDDCNYDNIRFCLPVLQADDVAFQFMVRADTVQEIQQLCGPYGQAIKVGIVNECNDTNFLVQFAGKPDVFALGSYQLLFNWPHGLPGFDSVIDVGECFRIRIEVLGVKFCSNCLERTADDCYTAVVEYGSEENSYGFNYCSSGEEEVDVTSCEPTIVPFTNLTTLTLPYTASMQAKYGNVPTIQTWIYDINGELLNMGITARMDAYPPTQLSWDFGGPASGVVVIK